MATPFGPVVGTTAEGVDRWLAIPYAPPPTGARRFAPPGPPPHWRAPRPALAAGAACPTLVGGEVSGAEDCLHLDVYRPSAAGHDMAVAVFVHGGSFVSGDSTDDDAARLADAGHMVVAVVDYRLGPLGFLADEGLDGAGATGGDAGLLDQEAALRWVATSARSFGGDPRKVAVFGESAGGISVCDLLAAPGATGLLAAAIDQSGPCTGAAEGPTVELAAAFGAGYGAAVGCPVGPEQPGCLRTASLERLLSGPPEFSGGLLPLPWRPAVGSGVLPRQPAAAVPSSPVVPLLVGYDARDGASFVPRRVTGQASYVAWLRSSFGNDAPAVQARYPVGPGDDAAAVAARVVTDAAFACPALDLAVLAAARQPGRVWAYDFADASVTADGAVHGSELSYLFGTPRREGPGEPFEVVAAWSKMLTSASPPPAWPAAVPGATAVEVVASPAPTASPDDQASHQCDLWDGRVASGL